MPNVSERLVAGFRQRVKLRLDVMANELKQEMLASLAPHIDEAVSRALADELETLVAVHLSAAGDQLRCLSDTLEQVIQLNRTPPAPVPPAPTPPVDTPPVEAPPTTVEEVLIEVPIPVIEPAPTPTPPVDSDRPTPPDHPTPGGRA